MRGPNSVREFISQKKQAYLALSQENKFFQPGLLVVVALLAIVGIYLIFRSFAATVQTLTFGPIADATVANKTAASTNYGANTTLVAVAGSATTSRKDFLLKFTVSGISGKKIDSIKVKLYATNGSASGGKIYGTANTVINSDNSVSALPDWNDGSVNWNTAYKTANPPLLDSIGTVSAGHWYNFNVTAAVKGDGTYTFRVANGSANNVTYGSKESATPPQLVATVEQPADSTPPSAPTNLTAEVRSGSITDLFWTPSMDNVGVVNYYAYTSDGTIAGATSNEAAGSTWVHVGTKPATQYSYYVKAVDASGNLSAPSNTVTITSNPIDTTDRTCAMPEGFQIEINTAGGYTCDSIYSMLKENAYPNDFAKVTAHFKIMVQDVYPSSVTAHSNTVNGTTWYSATMYLNGVGSSFSVDPDGILAHEYGHVWTLYGWNMLHNDDWTLYNNIRWDADDGSSIIAQNPLLHKSYEWDQAEMIAEDYRLLFGGPAAKYFRHINPDIADPRLQPGLKDWLLHTWANE